MAGSCRCTGCQVGIDDEGTGTMAVMTTLPHGRPLTRADLAGMPDDGHRYELVDGVLVVSPSPRPRHQRVVGELFVLLRAACPADLEVFVAPLDVVLAEDTLLIPDLLVTRRSDLDETSLPAAPVLAVEVLSPSTRRVDLMLKRSRCEAAGVPRTGWSTRTSPACWPGN